MKKPKYNFDIIFQKLAEFQNQKEQIISCQEMVESQEINKLREIVLNLSEDSDQYFSTT